MATLFSIPQRSLNSSTPVLEQDMAQDSRSRSLAPFPTGRVEYDVDEIICFSREDASGAVDTLVIPDQVREFLFNYFRSNQAVVPESHTAHVVRRSLVSYGMSYANNVADMCNVLRDWGEYALADRLAYLASDADLEEGEVPATLESARAFLTFFSKVESEGWVDLACSPDGEVSAVWRFPDGERRACVWFLPANRVTFAATDANGDFIKIDAGRDAGSPSVVMEKLVREGLLKWHKIPSASSYPATTLRDIAAPATWEAMVSRWKQPSISVTVKTTSPPTGWNTSTLPTGHFS